METLGSLRRTRYCGEVSLADAGQEMTVCGSVARARDKGGIIFADLRDTTGILQLVFDEDTPKDVFAKAESLRSEYVVICRGKLRERAAKTDKIATGDVNKIAEVVRDLAQRDVDEHGLSAGEKRMLTKARSILTSEIALSEHLDENEAQRLLDVNLGYEPPRPGDEDHHTEAPEEAAMDTLARVEAENKKSKKK